MIFVKRNKQDQLYISRDCYKALNSDYIVVMVNVNDRQIAFVPCQKDANHSVKIHTHIDHTK